ncbi:MAG TPA: 23S rRNA (uracil(1939)-C(5))-methyltransferase RlmD [Clostridiales bacterium]|nr:23S rRNA (uracil(1939)-C(5))-methyltransferase RlmD [Clostridiales bacterium]
MQEFSFKKNDILETEIVDINHRGQGVAKVHGFVVFVDDVIMGDIVKLKIKEVKKRYAVAAMVELLKKSPYRVEPDCKYFWACGGCQIMHMDYQKQLEYKKQRVMTDIKRSLADDSIIINDTIGMQDPYRYRNKGTFPVVSHKGKTAIGAYKLTSHDIVDLEACIIQQPIADVIINTFRTLMEALGIEPYDEIRHTGLVKHLIVRTNKNDEAMLIIVTSKNKLPYKGEIVSELLKKAPTIKSIILNINEDQTNVILGFKNKKLYGETGLSDWIFDLEFSISPNSFFQVNPIQTEVLYNQAIEYAQIDDTLNVFDIYCGIGTISLAMAKKAKHVYGIEIVQEAIEDANKNARKNKIENVDFYCGKAEEIFPKLHNQGVGADVVIVDPPRNGCERSVLDTIIKMKPVRVVYVSCNPATLARDLKILVDGGYKVVEVEPLDMFPHSVHVETCSLLMRQNRD